MLGQNLVIFIFVAVKKIIAVYMYIKIFTLPKGSGAGFWKAALAVMFNLLSGFFLSLKSPWFLSLKVYDTAYIIKRCCHDRALKIPLNFLYELTVYFLLSFLTFLLSFYLVFPNVFLMCLSNIAVYCNCSWKCLRSRVRLWRIKLT